MRIRVVDVPQLDLHLRTLFSCFYIVLVSVALSHALSPLRCSPAHSRTCHSHMYKSSLIRTSAFYYIPPQRLRLYGDNCCPEGYSGRDL